MLVCAHAKIKTKRWKGYRAYHAVEVEEEHDEVEAQLDEALLFVHVELAEDLRGVEQVLLLVDSAGGANVWSAIALVACADGSAAREWTGSGKGKRQGDILLGVEDGKRQVEHKGQPVAVDEEEQREEAVYGGLGDYVRVESVAEINGVDVVTIVDG